MSEQEIAEDVDLHMAALDRIVDRQKQRGCHFYVGRPVQTLDREPGVVVAKRPVHDGSEFSCLVDFGGHIDTAWVDHWYLVPLG